MPSNDYGSYVYNDRQIIFPSSPGEPRQRHWVNKLRLVLPDRVSKYSFTEQEVREYIQARANIEELFLYVTTTLDARENRLCIDYKSMRELLVNRWRGDQPIVEDRREQELFSTISILCSKVFQNTAIQLCSLAPEHFEIWWDPEHVSVHVWDMLDKYCAKHRALWEPYYVARKLQGSIMPGTSPNRVKSAYLQTEPIIMQFDE